MSYIDEATLDRWIKEDVPYLDLTTHVLGIGSRQGRLIMRSRAPIIVSGNDEACRVLRKFGAVVHHSVPDGTRVPAAQELLTATGSAAALHHAWKVCVNLLEYASGIATRTGALVSAARAVSPRIEIVTTRKGFPGTRELACKAVIAGGASPHRLGLSETILVFPQHRVFFSTEKAFAAQVAEGKTRAREKKFLVEVERLEDALAAIAAGADGLQFDKVPPAKLAPWVAELRALHPGVVLIAAGGVVPDNVAAYSATGVDALATSTVYHGAPADIGAEFSALD